MAIISNLPSTIDIQYGVASGFNFRPTYEGSYGSVSIAINVGLSDPSLPSSITATLGTVDYYSCVIIGNTGGLSPRYTGTVVLDVTDFNGTNQQSFTLTVGEGSSINDQGYITDDNIYIQDDNFIVKSPIVVNGNPESLPLSVTISLGKRHFISVDDVVNNASAQTYVPSVSPDPEIVFGKLARTANTDYVGVVYDVDGDKWFTSQPVPSNVYATVKHKKYKDYITGPQNVCVIYNTELADALEVAEYYVAARDIPAQNLIGISSTAHFPLQIEIASQSQMISFINDLLVKTDSIKNGILYYVLVGDFPSLYTTGIATRSSLDMTMSSRVYMEGGSWRTLGGGGVSAELNAFRGSAGAWSERSTINTAFDGQPFKPSSDAVRTDIFTSPGNYTNDFLIPNIKKYGDVSAVFRIPVGNYPEEVQIAKDRIDSMIAKESQASQVWGTTLAREGTSGVAILPLMRDMLDVSEDLQTLPTNFYYLDLGSETSGGAISHLSPIYPVEAGLSLIPASHDAAGNQVRDLLLDNFSNTLGDIWCIAPGRRSYTSTYQDPTIINKVMEPGDIDLEDGAIAVFSQSYGANPPPCLSESSREVHNMTVLAETAFTHPIVNGSPDTTEYRYELQGANRHGSLRNVFRFDISTVNAPVSPPTITVTSTNIIIKLDGHADFTYVHTGKTWEDILRDIQGPLRANYLINTYYNNRGYVWSRAYAAWRAGFCYATGVSDEPYSLWQTTTQGLYSTVFSGYSFGERALIVKSGYVLSRNQVPNYWIQYGDPLYRPYWSKLNMTTTTLHYTVGDFSGIAIFNPAPAAAFEGSLSYISSIAVDESVVFYLINPAGGTVAPPPADNLFYSITIADTTLLEANATVSSSAAGTRSWTWPAGSVPNGTGATLISAGVVDITITNVVPITLTTQYANISVTKGATVAPSTYDWGVSHWSGEDSVLITGAPASIDVTDPSDPVGTWPNEDITYLVKAVATNTSGAAVPTYFTITVGAGSSYVYGEDPGGGNSIDDLWGRYLTTKGISSSLGMSERKVKWLKQELGV